MTRLRSLDDELLRPWHILGLALSSTLARRTEEVLIKFTVGHFVPSSDWLPSILSFPPSPPRLPLCLFLFLRLSFSRRPYSISLSLSLSFTHSLSFSLLSFDSSSSSEEARHETHASRHFPRKKSAIGFFVPAFHVPPVVFPPKKQRAPRERKREREWVADVGHRYRESRPLIPSALNESRTRHEFFSILPPTNSNLFNPRIIRIPREPRGQESSIHTVIRIPLPYHDSRHSVKDHLSSSSTPNTRSMNLTGNPSRIFSREIASISIHLSPMYRRIIARVVCKNRRGNDLEGRKLRVDRKPRHPLVAVGATPYSLGSVPEISRLSSSVGPSRLHVGVHW